MVTKPTYLDLEKASKRLREAILGRSRLSVVYGGVERLIEPYALGRSSNGNLLLRAYQVDGFSKTTEFKGPERDLSSGRPKGAWKLLSVEKLEDITFTGDKFNNLQPDYVKGDVAMTRGIIEEV